MEFVRGKTLGDLIEAGRIPGVDCLKYATQIADALSAAHSIGIIHRDLKPSNVMVTADGLVKVLDFESPSASVLSSSPEGAITGTVAYMSPEQAQGQTTDVRSDIFSFGTVLYEMLTGEQAFQGSSSLAILTAVLRDNPYFSKSNVDAPTDVQEIVLRCLRKDQDQRFQSMRDVKSAIEQIYFATRSGVFNLAPASAGGSGEWKSPAASLPSIPAPSGQPFPAEVTWAAGPSPPKARAEALPPPPTSENETLERALDLAVVPKVPVKIAIELIALLRLPNSKSLAQTIGKDRDTSVKRDDVRSHKFLLDFLRDAAGRAQPIDVTMRVNAPDFDPPQIEKLVRVHPDRDCERQVFLLAPQVTGVLRIQFDLLLHDLTLASRVLRTQAVQTDRQSLPEDPVVVSVPIMVDVQPQRRFPRRVAAMAIAAGLICATGFTIWTHLRSHPGSEAQNRGVKPALIASNPASASNRNGVAQTKSYSLLIALDHYDYWPPLRNPIKDAGDIERELTGSYGFVTRSVRNATRDEILRAIKSFHTIQYSPGDQLLVYFAGHGTFDEQEQRGFLIARDSKRDTDDPVHTTQLSHDDLRAVLDTLPVPHIFVVIDACFGGTFDPRIGQSTHRGDGDEAISLEEFRRRRIGLTTRQFLTSGSKEFVSDGKGENSPFARVFLQALRSYGGDQHYLTIARLRPWFEKTQSDARQGDFGHDAAGSEFFFAPVRN
jgi:hypothetical protein